MKKMLSLLLCVLLLVCPVLVACDSDDGDESSNATSKGGETSAPVSQSSIYKDEDGNYTVAGLGMPEFNFTEDEFRVCVYNNVIQNTYFSEEVAPDLYDTTDTVLNDAVRTRNDLIEEQYGVKIVACQVDDVYQAVDQDVTATTGLYDAAMPFMSACTTLAQGGVLYDLNQFSDYIHLDAPWWDQSANESLSIAGKIYFTTGDISIMQKIVSTAVLFNKSMYQELCYGTYGSLYDLVRDHKWTLDTMHEMGKLATKETDGNSGMTIDDTWGMAGTDGVASFYIASGNSLITKDQDDIPVLALGETESSLLYAEKVLTTFQDSDWFLNTQRLAGQVDNVWEAAMGVFGEERALFYPCAFSAVKKLRNFEVTDNFGFVPNPLAMEGQEKYYTNSSCAYAYGICIPKGVPNPEFSAYMIELMACGGKNTITPAYYDVTLKTRDAKDDDSEKMLDEYIFSNVVYDLGVLYNFGGVSGLFTSLMSTGDTNIASSLQAISDAIDSSILDYVDAYMMDE